MVAPRIWFSRILTHGRLVPYTLTSSYGETIQSRMEYHSWYDPLWADLKKPYDEFSGSFVPDQLATTPNKRIPDFDRMDAFIVASGFLVVSQRFCDLLRQFDLGSTRLIEVRFMKDRHMMADMPPYFLLHLSEAKEAFVAELSENVCAPTDYKGYPAPGRPWTQNELNDVPALMEHAAFGVDLWYDPKLWRRIFLSDRLALAMDEAGIIAPGLEPQQAKVVP